MVNDASFRVQVENVQDQGYTGPGAAYLYLCIKAEKQQQFEI